MIRFLTLASGSKGNAALLSYRETHLLIDCGISYRRLRQHLETLSMAPEQLSAILITHEHTDHTIGLATYTKKHRTPILCSRGTGQQLCRRVPGLPVHPIPMLAPLQWGDVEVTMLPTSHDCAESSAFCFRMGGRHLGYLTDSGVILPETAHALLGSDLLVLESNHDVEMLRRGSYPEPLKQRVASRWGHLSNDAASQFAAESVRCGTSHLILAHLSEENNTPQCALDTMRQSLCEVGFCGTLSVAPQHCAGDCVWLEELVCSV